MNTKFMLLLFAVSIHVAGCQCGKDKEKGQLELELQRQKAELDSLKHGNVQETLADKYDHVHKSVVMIVAEGDEEVSQGSGVVITESGDAISNFHVFNGSRRAYVVDADGNKYPVTKIYRFSDDDDYIFFKIGNGQHQFQPARIAQVASKIGEPCFTVGNPRGLEQTLSNGIISAYRENNMFIQNTANITHGSSGGALFNDKGEVIGITSEGFVEDNLFFAINIQKLPLDNYKNDYDLSRSQSNPAVNNGDAVATIKSYLLAEEHRDFEEIYSYFSNGLQRYWDLYSPTKEQLYARYKHAWSVAENSVNDLKEIKKVNDYTYIYTVDFTYFSIKDQTYKTVSNSRVEVIFDSGYKIMAIYGI